jgi:hypothetical protein
MLYIRRDGKWTPVSFNVVVNRKPVFLPESKFPSFIPQLFILMTELINNKMSSSSSSSSSSYPTESATFPVTVCI